jgi:hypothetical protein
LSQLLLGENTFLEKGVGVDLNLIFTIVFIYKFKQFCMQQGHSLFAVTDFYHEKSQCISNNTQSATCLGILSESFSFVDTWGC